MIAIEPVDRIPDRPALEQLLRDFMVPNIAGFNAATGLRVDPQAILARTWEHIDDYLPPAGRLLLAHDGQGALVGCVFLRRVGPDAGEMKRLFVRPELRGQGVGRRLVERLHDEARAMGLGRILLDTGADNLASQSLYAGLGYERIDRYPENDNEAWLAPYLVFMRRDLAAGS